MNTYQNQVLRFLPDRVSGEFVNLSLKEHVQIIIGKSLGSEHHLRVFF
jgi:hypothetical protein